LLLVCKCAEISVYKHLPEVLQLRVVLIK